MYSNHNFKLSTELIEWKLRTAQEKFEDPIQKAIQNALDASCTIVLGAGGKTWTGSGFHIGNGLIVTAAHVAPIEMTSSPYEIFVTFDGKSMMPAVVAVSEHSVDAAILFCQNAIKIPSVQLTNSENVKVGDIISVIGSPEGWHDTATVGRVSNVNQQLGQFAPTDAWNDIIFIDADILPGASGGMVIGTDGKVIGSVIGVVGQQADIGIGERAVCPSNKIINLLSTIAN
jgi:S1-C subfamily serine protease